MKFCDQLMIVLFKNIFYIHEETLNQSEFDFHCSSSRCEIVENVHAVVTIRFNNNNINIVGAV